jgi:hypothetical protein
MDKEFVPYELALRMKKLKSMDKGFRYGFNEKTFAYFVEGFPNDKLIISSKPKLYSYEYNGGGPELISAPLFQQAFRWFESKGYRNYVASNKFGGEVNYWFAITPPEELTYSDVEGRSTKEAAELACLKKLIEIVESKSE